VDERLQRPLREAWVKGHVDRFDPNAVGTITVSSRKGGGYVIIDGQHRHALILAMGWGDQLVPCVVLRGLSFQQEAQLFVDLNGERTQPQSIDIFIQRVNAKDPAAVEIVGIAAELGLTIGRGNHSGNIQATSSLDRVFSGDRRTGPGRNPKVLRDVLWTVVKAWGADAGNFNGAIMQGLGCVYLRDGAIIERGDMAIALANHGTAARLVGKARTARDGHGGTLARAIAGAATDIYNRKRRINKLTSWWT